MMGGGESNEKLRLAFTELAGGEDRFAEWRKAWLDNYIEKEDIQSFQSLRFNTVRVPLDWRDFVDGHDQKVQLPPFPEQLGPTTPIGYIYLDRLMSWCTECGVYVLPDMHVTPDTINKDTGNIYVDTIEQSNPNLEKVKAAWSGIARRYRTAHNLFGYDLLNEPRGYIDNKLRPTYRQIRNAIREQDSAHLIVVEPNVYSDLGNPSMGGGTLGEPIDDRMVLSPHFYGGEVPESIAVDEAQHGRKYLNWLYASVYKIPMLIGETGENDNDWTNRMVSLWRKGRGGITAGTLYWTYKKPGDSVRCVKSVPWVKGWDRVSKYLSKGGQIPAGSFNILMDQAVHSGATQSTLHRDVQDALVRDYSTGHLLPFYSSNGLGQTLIRATDYDLGRAAKDAEDEAGAYFTHNGQTITYQVRNDRVGTSAADGGSLGYLSDGDWQKYTVNPGPGKFRARIRYAAPNAGSKVQLRLDGEELMTAMLPATGGWDKFQEYDLGSVTVKSGVPQSLKVTEIKAGLNLSSIAFTP